MFGRKRRHEQLTETLGVETTVGLAAEFSDTLEGYASLTGEDTVAELDDAERARARQIAADASAQLCRAYRNIDELSSLGPILDAARPITVLTRLSESLMLMAELGPRHELVLSYEEAGMLGAEPEVINWLEAVASLGKQGLPELSSGIERPHPRSASDAEAADVERELIPLLDAVAAEYRDELYVEGGNGSIDTDPSVTLRARELAVGLARTRRSAFLDGRDVASYPEPLAHRLGVVAPFVYPSLCIIGLKSPVLYFPLEPDYVLAMLADTEPAA